ncbi:unnamed protein product [Peniophora sp. CBMAI 1063]|nr:unnamed protein product [Peniophora sp. CBMAI 1063]
MDDDFLSQIVNDSNFVAYMKVALDDDPRKLGEFMWLCYQLIEPSDIEILNEAIQATQQAVEHSQDLGLSDHSQLYFDLGVRLKARANLTHSLDDISQAMSAFEAAVDLTSDDDPDQPERLNRLGASQIEYFRRVGKIDDLNSAVTAFRRAFNLRPECHPDRPMILNNLGSSLQARFKQTGVLDDIEQAVSSHRHTVELTPDGHPDKPSRFNNLGNSLYTRFKRTGELDDIEQAVLSHRHAVELTPHGHPGKPLRFNNLGNSLHTRFEHTGELDDIEQSVLSHRRAVELTPDGHPDKPSRFGSLGGSLHARFHRTGELDDIEQAVSSHRRAIELTPDGHPDKPGQFSNLGGSLHTRHGRTGELDDIEQAVSSHRRAVELAPDGHYNKPAYFGNLGGSLHTRFERTGVLDDIEQAVSSHRRAIELTPDGHPDKPGLFSNLGGSLHTRFQRTGELDDIEQAISSHRRAAELTPDGHPDKPVLFSNLGIALCARFKRTGEFNDIEQAISSHRRAVDLTPDGHLGKASRLMKLGSSFRARHEHDSSEIDCTAAIACYMEATVHTSGSPSLRLASASRCIRLLRQNPSVSTTDSLLSAHSRIIAVLPEIVWLGYDIQRRYAESSRVGKLINDAVSAAIAAAALTLAVEWLEAGRSLIWAQVLSLRTPLDELNESYPELAKSLRRVQQGLRSSARSSFAPEMMIVSDVPGLATNQAADAHRALAIEHDDLLKKIRACPGFQDFLRPKSFDALSASFKSLNNPVVFINVNVDRCDALCLYPSGEITLVPLPSLTLDRATKLSALWSRILRNHMVRARGAVRWDGVEGLPLLHRALERIWTWIVSPVLDALDLASLVHGEQLPNITWCPTGPLTQLPLHAAGVYSKPDGPRAFEFIVSSYTPSLSALLRSHQATATLVSTANALIVTQPATPRLPPLPGTKAEGRKLRDFLGSLDIATELLEHEQASTDSVSQDIGRYSWVHLACHGSQNPADATKSAFHLYDGPLTLSDLMGTVSENAELAFLSACQTAVGDEKVPEESAHLAAGMLAVGFKGVVATMWSIGDADAPVVVEAYYKELIALRDAGVLRRGETGAAYALHAATRVLREKVGEAAFMRWVPFVHFGV